MKILTALLAEIERGNVMQKSIKLSDQALGALMLALQNSLLTQTDIVPVLKSFELFVSNDEVFVSNPPTARVSLDEEDDGPTFISEE